MMFLVRLLTFFICLLIACQCNSVQCDEISVEGTSHPIIRRFIQVYSKPPGEAAEVYKGRNAMQHLANVFKGGSMGIEMNLKKHTEKLSDFWKKAKLFFSAKKHAEKRSDKQPRFYPPIHREFEKPMDEPEKVPDPNDADLVEEGFINPRLKPPSRFREKLLEG